MTTTTQIPAPVRDLIDGFRHSSTTTSSRGYVRRQIRLSRKQLWLLAYKSRETTGIPFVTDGRNYPVEIAIGHWPDGSVDYARAWASSANGPYWIEHTVGRI